MSNGKRQALGLGAGLHKERHFLHDGRGIGGKGIHRNLTRFKFGKIQHVDTVELVVFAVLDQLSDRIGHSRIGGLFQQRNLGLNVAHIVSLEQIAHGSKQWLLTEA